MARKILCVTFDCYGTLIDWEGGLAGALMSVPALRGSGDQVRRMVEARERIERGLIVSAPDLAQSDSPDERYETPPYRPYREILSETVLLAGEELGFDIAPEEAAAVAASMPRWEPFPETREALEAIRRRFPIGILSNVEEEVIAQTIERIGVPFDLVVTAEKVEAYKPAPDHWYAAMHELEADEEELFHLSVSPFHDLETATLLGIPCGYVNRAGQPLLPEAKPTFTVRDLAGAARKLAGYPSGRTPPRSGRAIPAPRRPGD